MTWYLWIIWIIFAYCLGSIPFAYIFVRFFKNGLDIRTVGSGNVGSTNTLRQAGPGVAAIVFVLDTLKGFIPAFIGMHIYAANMPNMGDIPIMAFVGAIAATYGHFFPVWLNFKGGKGVATAFGVLIAVSPLVAAITLVSWFVVMVASGYVSLGGCVAAVIAAASLGIVYQNLLVFFIFFVIAAGINFRHAVNYRNIIAGKESKVFRRK
jgi:glycerol-3-phosphate acyltransferase PlsY